MAYILKFFETDFGALSLLLIVAIPAALINKVLSDDHDRTALYTFLDDFPQNFSMYESIANLRSMLYKNIDEYLIPISSYSRVFSVSLLSISVFTLATSTFLKAPTEYYNPWVMILLLNLISILILWWINRRRRFGSNEKELISAKCSTHTHLLRKIISASVRIALSIFCIFFVLAWLNTVTMNIFSSFVLLDSASSFRLTEPFDTGSDIKFHSNYILFSIVLIASAYLAIQTWSASVSISLTALGISIFIVVMNLFLVAERPVHETKASNQRLSISYKSEINEDGEFAIREMIVTRNFVAEELRDSVEGLNPPYTCWISKRSSGSLAAQPRGLSKFDFTGHCTSLDHRALLEIGKGEMLDIELYGLTDKEYESEFIKYWLTYHLLFTLSCMLALPALMMFCSLSIERWAWTTWSTTEDTDTISSKYIAILFGSLIITFLVHLYLVVHLVNASAMRNWSFLVSNNGLDSYPLNGNAAAISFVLALPAVPLILPALSWGLIRTLQFLPVRVKALLLIDHDHSWMQRWIASFLISLLLSAVVLLLLVIGASAIMFVKVMLFYVWSAVT